MTTFLKCARVGRCLSLGVVDAPKVHRRQVVLNLLVGVAVVRSKVNPKQYNLFYEPD